MAEIKPGELSYNDVCGDPEMGDEKQEFSEVYDFTRESICMSDPETAYVTSIYCNGLDVTPRCVYANTYFGIVILSDNPEELADNEPIDVGFALVRGPVAIKYDIEGCVSDNKGTATIILPVI